MSLKQRARILEYVIKYSKQATPGPMSSLGCLVVLRSIMRTALTKADQGLHNNAYYGTNVAEYSDSGIAKVANLMGTVLASLLPVLAIIVLHLTEGTGVRLGLVGIFSALFSTCLWLLNNGKVVEVFAATSA